MKKKTKNIIIITLIIILGIASGFTIKLAKDSVSTNSENIGQNMETPPDQGGQGGPGQNDNNEAGTEQSNGSMGQKQGTPPAKPDGSSDNSNMSEPPTKPDDSNGNSTSESPTKPEDGSNNGSSEMPTRPSDNNGMPTENRQSKEIDIEYYILFGVEAFLISLLSAFLIMSNFNKKTIAMTLSGAKNIVILVLIVAILTAVLAVAQAFIANKLIETNQTQSGMQASNGMQMPGGNGGASSNVTYTASKEITEDATISSGEYSSTTADENALLASGDINVSVSNVNVTKTGDSDGGDSSNFYGNNSAVIAKDGANLALDNITVTTNADGANGVFSYGGSTTTNNGDTLYITNTTATINLENNTIVNNDSTGNFLRAQKDSWGKSGSNGGNVTLKMTKQKAEGNIVIDSISTLDMEMAESSYYEGTINGANEAKSITLKLDSTSKIKLTDNSYVTSLEDADATYSNIDFNGYKLYVNGVAIN